MRAAKEQAKELMPLVKQLWPEHPSEELTRILEDYISGTESVIFAEQYRTQGIARVLCQECESWAKEMGCAEFASDCELTNTVSLQFHLSIGFAEESRIICFKKMI